MSKGLCCIGGQRFVGGSASLLDKRGCRVLPDPPGPFCCNTHSLNLVCFQVWLPCTLHPTPSILFASRFGCLHPKVKSWTKEIERQAGGEALPGEGGTQAIV